MRVARPRLALTAALLCALACSRDLSLPPTASNPPLLTSLTPAKAFSGATVKLQGHDLGVGADTVTIHFGASAAVHPISISSDQTEADVVVPDDASTGDAQLSTALGQSSLTAAFTWQGAGHLLHRELAATSNLQQGVQPLPLPGRGQIAFYSTWWAAVHLVGADGVVQRPKADWVEVAASYGDGAGLVAVSAGTEDATCPALSVWDFPASGAPVRTCLPPTTPPESLPDYLGSSPDGKQLASAGESAVWWIDRSGATLRVVQSNCDNRPRSPAWRAAGGFVVADGGTLRLIDGTTGALSAAVPVPGLLASDDTWLDVRGNLVAVSGASGSLVIADATSWPPAFGPPASTFGFFGQVAFSADSKQLVLTDVLHIPGRIDLFDVSGGATAAPRPLNSVVAQGIDQPFSPIIGPDGTFYVGGMGGWYVVSDVTGAVIAHLLTNDDLTPPRLVLQPVLGADPELQVVFLSRSADSTIYLDPQSVQMNAADIGYGADDVIASADTTDSFWLTGGTVTRNHDASTAFTLPAGSFTGSPKLSLAPNGGALFLRYQVAATPELERVVVLDPKGSWTTDPAPAQLGLTQTLVAIGSDGQDRVALLGESGGQVFDLAAALHLRTVAPVGVPLAPRFPQTTNRAAASDGKRITALYKFTSTSSTFRETSWDLANGSFLSDFALPPTAEPLDDTDTFDSMVAAPGGRRLYWLAGSADQRRLLTLVTDPVSGQVVGEEDPISMPGGARDLLVYPDGQSLLVLDATQDTVLLYK